MAKNDENIRNLLKVIETKKEKLGSKPKAAWKTNCIFKNGERSHLNLNTINTLDNCVIPVAIMIQEQKAREEASKLLEVPFVSSNWNGFSFEEWTHDFKLRASMIAWDIEKKKLNILENKLSDLRSEDAKTEDAISDIMKDLE